MIELEAVTEKIQSHQSSIQKWQTIEITEEMSPRAKIASARLNSLGSLYWFSKYTLRHTRLSPGLHGFLCRQLEQDSLRLSLEVPRDHFKTTLASVSAPIWWALPFNLDDEELMRSLGYGDAWIRWMKRAHDTCTRTLIASEIIDNAVKIGVRIAGQYESNSLFRELFAEIIPKKSFEDNRGPMTKKKWNLKSMTHLRLGTEQHGEGTFDLIGVKGALQSRHYNRQVIDDPVGEKAIKSDIVMGDTCEWIKKLSGALDSDPNDPNKLEDQLFIGNRWSQRDVGAWLRKNQPNMQFETHSAEGGCCKAHPGGDPIFPEEFTMSKLADMRKVWGPYDYACFPPGQPVLMSDWSEKRIGQLQVGDEIVGFSLDGRRRLVKAKVEHVQWKQLADIIKATTDAGRVIYCTPDHKFLRNKKSRYGKLEYGCGVTSVYNPLPILDIPVEEQLEWRWIAGIIDGEGAVKHGNVQIIQSVDKNPEVCKAIEKSLSVLGIEYSTSDRDRERRDQDTARIYTLKGGKRLKMMLLKYGKPAKGQFIRDVMWRNAGRIGEPERIVSIELIATQMDVVNIQSSSGNYVCQGYAVKNCQFLNNPVDPESVRFKMDWLRHFSINVFKGEQGVTTANSQQLSHVPSPADVIKAMDKEELAGATPRRLKAAIYHETRNGEVIEDLRAANMTRIAILDPNHSEESGRSRNAIVVIGLYHQPPLPRRIYLLESWAESGSHDNMIGKMLSLREGSLGLAFKWRVHHIYLESKVAGQQGWYRFFREKILNMGMAASFSVRELKTDRSANAKQTRIIGMEVLYENGFFWVNRSGCQQFLDEFQVYPNGSTIDLLDVVGYSSQCWEPGAKTSNRDMVREELARRQRMAQSVGVAGY